MKRIICRIFGHKLVNYGERISFGVTETITQIREGVVCERCGKKEFEYGGSLIINWKSDKNKPCIKQYSNTLVIDPPVRKL